MSKGRQDSQASNTPDETAHHPGCPYCLKTLDIIENITEAASGSYHAVTVLCPTCQREATMCYRVGSWTEADRTRAAINYFLSIYR